MKYDIDHALRTARYLLILLLLGLPSLADAATCSTAFCTLNMNSRIWINNNTWGSADSPPGWWESITTNTSNTFRTDFYWPSGPNNNKVKAFPSAVLGWHWGWRLQNTGLPVQLAANQNINTSYAYTVAFGTGGVGNVAYDIWMHTQSNPLYENPSDEIMIWVNRTGGAAPIGNVIATVNIGGSTWNLHRGNIGWEVWSFVRTTNSGIGSLNIKNFTDYLRTYWGLSSLKYVTSVQFGTEIFQGRGYLNVTNYTATVGSAPAIVPNGTYRIMARHSGKALDVLNQATADGANVVQWTYSGSNNQRWRFTHLGDNVYQIIGVQSGKALQVASASTANGTNINIRTYTGAANQRWRISATGAGYYRFTPVSSPGSAMDVSGAVLTDGGDVLQWAWSGVNNQQWAILAP